MGFGNKKSVPDWVRDVPYGGFQAGIRKGLPFWMNTHRQAWRTICGALVAAPPEWVYADELEKSDESLAAKVRLKVEETLREIKPADMIWAWAVAEVLPIHVNELASTLLFVAHNRGRFIAGHVGDGVIAQVDGDDSAKTLSHPENGEYANTTVFVTDSSATNRLRLFHGELDTRVAGFVLMSDGCAESLYNKQSGNPAAAVSKLIAWNATLSRNNINSVLRSNLEQSFSKKSSDDCSLALLSILA